MNRHALELCVIGRRTIGNDVAILDLARHDGGALPAWTPGSHVDIDLGLEPDGGRRLRQYSLCGHLEETRAWRIAVRRDAMGRGGSRFIHDHAQLGTVLPSGYPRNHFALVDAPAYLFIAGGIGITPILPMARLCAAQKRPWRAVYLGRSPASMPFADELTAIGPSCVTLYASETRGRCSLAKVVQDLHRGTAVFACGPATMIDELEALAADSLGHWALNVERFEPRAAVGGDVEIIAKRSGITFRVAAGQSILSALKLYGIAVDSSCRSGVCGTCEVRVLEGDIEHRDQLLTEAERAAGRTMMTCVSWGRSGRLVLDV